MGIDTQWKKKWRILFPSAWLIDLRDHSDINTVIDDFSLHSYRSLTRGASKGSEIADRINKRMHHVWTRHLKRYIIVFDDGKWVPLSKQPEQFERAKKSTITTLTEEEEKKFRITEGHLPNIEKVLESRELKNDLFRFMTESILKVKYPRDIVDIIISSGRVNCRTPTHSRDACTHNIRNTDHISNANRMSKNGTLLTNVKFMSNLHLTDSVWIKKEKGNAPKCYNPHAIGEGDLKIVTEISKLFKEGHRDLKVLIRSYDSDLIPILLLAMRDYIDKDTHNISPMIFIDTSFGFNVSRSYNDNNNNSSSNNNDRNNNSKIRWDNNNHYGNKNYHNNRYNNNKNGQRQNSNDVSYDMLCVNTLWREIHMLFRDKYPLIDNPIETFVVLTLLSGCDFILKKFDRIGPAAIWDAFDGGGWKIFAGPESEPDTITIDTELLPDGSTTRVFGDPDRHHDIKIMEYRIYNFIRYIYTMLITNTSIIPDRVEHLPSMDRLRRINGDNPRKPSFWYMRSDDEIVAIIRRIYWIMFYWTNGPKGADINLNPTQVDPVSGLSLWGWEEVEGVTKDGRQCLFVKEANKVHILSVDPN